MTIQAKTPSQRPVSDRRNLLKWAAVTVGTIAVSGVSSNVDVPGSEAKEASIKPRKKGYHVTPHIKTYYEKARF